MDRANRIRLAIAGVLVAFGILAAALPKRWIEEVIGYEPDGGNGAIELAIALVPLAIGGALAIPVFLAERRRRTAQRSTD